MKRAIFLLPSIFVFLAFIAFDDINPEEQWSQYRGHLANGWLDDTDLPETWDLESNQNIRWKYKTSGLGLSCPVIWGDKLFITTAVSEADKTGLDTGIGGDIAPVNDNSNHEWKIICINKNTGQLIWEKVACMGIPKQKRHPKSTHANCTVATNGKYVVTFFGSEGLYCYDMEGELIWKKNFGLLRSTFFRVESAEWEFASSPIIHEGKVVIQCDVMENSFLGLYDITTGKEIWKKERDEYPGWCTPNIYKSHGKTIIAVNGYKHRGGYDFETGEEIWSMSGGGDIQVPTPILGDHLIYFNSAHGPSSPILAIEQNAIGDITLKGGKNTNKFVRWSYPRGGSYMQTMLLYDGYLYNLNWNGRISCFDPENGDTIYNEKLGRANSFIASLVASDGKLYAVSDEGEVYIIKSGREFEIIAQNSLNDVSMVTPAISKGAIFFRTQNFLIAVGKQ